MPTPGRGGKMKKRIDILSELDQLKIRHEEIEGKISANDMYFYRIISLAKHYKDVDVYEIFDSNTIELISELEMIEDRMGELSDFCEEFKKVRMPKELRRKKES